MVLADPVSAGTAPPDTAPPDTVPPDTVPPGTVLPLVPAAGGVLSVEPLPLVPVVGGLDVDDAGAGEPPPAGVDTGVVTLGWAVLDGEGELGWQGVLVALAVFLPPVALVLALADAVVLARLLAVELAPVVSVAVAVALPVAVAVALSPGLLLVLPLDGLPAGLAGGAVGFTDPAA